VNATTRRERLGARVERKVPFGTEGDGLAVGRTASSIGLDGIESALAVERLRESRPPARAAQ
jgi:hypothetical protein